MPTHDATIFLPLLLQILLTAVVYVCLGVAKSRAVKTGGGDPQRRALSADAWPDSVIKINNNIRNQMEVPVLFYVLVLVLYSLDAAGVLAKALAWAFVASRIVHAWVHIGSNHVPTRRAVFSFGVSVVMVMLGVAAWAVFEA